MAKQVYATVQNKAGDDVRLGATLSEDGEMVLIYPAGGTTAFGWYKIERFEGGKLTAGSLKKMFSP